MLVQVEIEDASWISIVYVSMIVVEDRLHSSASHLITFFVPIHSQIFWVIIGIMRYLSYWYSEILRVLMAEVILKSVAACDL
jgi:hypothetical protein